MNGGRRGSESFKSNITALTLKNIFQQVLKTSTQLTFKKQTYFLQQRADTLDTQISLLLKSTKNAELKKKIFVMTLMSYHNSKEY